MYFCVTLLIILKALIVFADDATSTVQTITVKLLVKENRCDLARKLVVISNRTLNMEVVLDADDVLRNVSCVDYITTNSYGMKTLEVFNPSKITKVDKGNFIASFQYQWLPVSRWLCTFAVSERNIVCDLSIHVRSDRAFFAVNKNEIHVMVPNNETDLDYDADLTYECNYTEGQVIYIHPFEDFHIYNATVVQNGRTLFSYKYIYHLEINTNYIKGVFWMYFTAEDKYKRFYVVKLKLSPLLDPIKLNGMLKITYDSIVINSQYRYGNVYEYYYSSESDRNGHVKCEKRSPDSLILKLVDEFGNKIQGENKIEVNLKLKPNDEFTKIQCILEDDKQQVVEEHNIFYKLDPEYARYIKISSFPWNRTIYIASGELGLTYEENEILNVYCFSSNVSSETCSIAWLYRDKVISGNTIIEENKCINSQNFVLTKEDNDTTIVCFNNKTHDTTSVKLFMNYSNYLDVVSVSTHWLWVAVPIIALIILVAWKCLHWKRNKASTEVGNGGAPNEENLYEEIPDPIYNVVYDHWDTTIPE